MLIGIDTSLCIVSLRSRTISTKIWNQNSLHLEDVFLPQSVLIFFSVHSSPIGVMGINSGYFRAICRVYLRLPIYEAIASIFGQSASNVPRDNCSVFSRCCLRHLFFFKTFFQDYYLSCFWNSSLFRVNLLTCSLNLIIFEAELES